MSENQSAEDPEPCEPVPAGALYVPVRPGATGCCARFFRTPLGVRTAVAFTTERRLTATLGPQQNWIRLSEPAVRALAAPLGITALTVDPPLAAPLTGPRSGPARAAEPRTAKARAAAPRRERRPDRDPQAAGLARLAGMAAVISCVNLFIA